MFDENSKIYAYFLIEQSHFDLFLNNFFDSNGNCVIKGVSLTKEEAIDKVSELKKENETIVSKERKMELQAFWQTVLSGDLSQEDISDEFIDSHIKRMTSPKTYLFHDLSVDIELDVIQYSEDAIRSIFVTGSLSLEDENDLGVKKICLDNTKYGLDGTIKSLPVGMFGITKEEKEKRLNKDYKKRESIIEEILKYKRKIENIDNGIIENGSAPSQLSSGRHI